MTSPDAFPHADPESLPELVEEGRCVEHECASRGVGLHVGHHHGTGRAPAPIMIGQATRQLLDGYPDYGT